MTNFFRKKWDSNKNYFYWKYFETADYEKKKV